MKEKANESDFNKEIKIPIDNIEKSENLKANIDKPIEKKTVKVKPVKVKIKRKDENNEA